jgi:hypothetical protein
MVWSLHWAGREVRIGPWFLCDGHNEVLAILRWGDITDEELAKLLSHADFRVDSASTHSEIDTLPADPSVDLGIVGHTYSPKESSSFAQQFRSRWPNAIVLFLTQDDAPFDCVAENQYRYASTNPGRLIEACKRILGGS